MSPVYNVCETNDGVRLSSVAQQCKYSQCSRPGAGSRERSPQYLGCRLGHAQRHPFRQLDWPTLWWRRTILSMTLFHQLVHHGEGPLAECMSQLSSATGRSVRKPHQLILGTASSTKRLNGCFYSAAILWNMLPAKDTGQNEPETVSRVSRRPLESAEVQPPPEPGLLSDTLFQNFGNSPPPLSLSLSPYLSISLSLHNFSVNPFNRNFHAPFPFALSTSHFSFALTCIHQHWHNFFRAYQHYVETPSIRVNQYPVGESPLILLIISCWMQGP